LNRAGTGTVMYTAINTVMVTGIRIVKLLDHVVF